ncbi:unnamed protein product, partial [Prorocentrum cordatum]
EKGLKAQRKITERSLRKRRAQEAYRDAMSAVMAEIASFWPPLTLQERKDTLALHPSWGDLANSSSGTHKEEGKEIFLSAQTAGVMCTCANSWIIYSLRELVGS